MEDNRRQTFVNKAGNLFIFLTTVENELNHMLPPTTAEDVLDEACFESTSQSGREEGEIIEPSHALTLPFHLLESVVKGLLKKLDILDTDLSETLVSSLIKALAYLAGINIDVCSTGGFTEDTVLQIINEALGILAHKINLKTAWHENCLVVGYVTTVLSAAIISNTVLHPEALKNYKTESLLLSGSNPEFSVKKELTESCAASPSSCKSISEMNQHSDQEQTHEKCSGDQKADADNSPISARRDVRPRVKRGFRGSLSKLFSFKNRVSPE